MRSFWGQCPDMDPHAFQLVPYQSGFGSTGDPSGLTTDREGCIFSRNWRYGR